MSSLGKVRKEVIYAIIGLACLYSGVSLLLEAWFTLTKEQETDFVAVYEERFLELQKDLSPEIRYGYISDNLGENKSLRENMARYYLASYALAPSIIVNSNRYSYIVGDFYNLENVERLPPSFTILKYYGDGVFLIENVGI